MAQVEVCLVTGTSFHHSILPPTGRNPLALSLALYLSMLKYFSQFLTYIFFITTSFHSFFLTSSSGFKLVQLVVLTFLSFLESSCSSSCFSSMLESMEYSIDYMPFFSGGSNFFFHHRNINVDGQPRIFKAFFEEDFF
jgi:hypothetical protein